MLWFFSERDVLLQDFEFIGCTMNSGTRTDPFGRDTPMQGIDNKTDQADETEQKPHTEHFSLFIFIVVQTTAQKAIMPFTRNRPFSQIILGCKLRSPMPVA